MHVALSLLAMFTLLSTLIVSARWYHSEPQFRLREARARILHPYKHWI